MAFACWNRHILLEFMPHEGDPCFDRLNCVLSKQQLLEKPNNHTITLMKLFPELFTPECDKNRLQSISVCVPLDVNRELSISYEFSEIHWNRACRNFRWKSLGDYSFSRSILNHARAVIRWRSVLDWVDYREKQNIESKISVSRRKYTRMLVKYHKVTCNSVGLHPNRINSPRFIIQGAWTTKTH